MQTCFLSPHPPFDRPQPQHFCCCTSAPGRLSSPLFIGRLATARSLWPLSALGSSYAQLTPPRLLIMSFYPANVPIAILAEVSCASLPAWLFFSTWDLAPLISSTQYRVQARTNRPSFRHQPPVPPQIVPTYPGWSVAILTQPHPRPFPGHATPEKRPLVGTPAWGVSRPRGP